MKLKNNLLGKKLYVVFILNYLIIVFISIKYLSFLENSFDLITIVFLILTFLSHFFTIAVIPLLISLLIRFITKHASIVVFINILLSTFLIIYIKLDTIVFCQFRYHISPMILNMVFGKRASDIFQFSFINIFISLLFLLFIVAIQIGIHFISKKIIVRFNNLKIKKTVFTSVICLILSNFIFAWSDANYYGKITQTKDVFPVFFPLTADDFLLELGLVDLEKTKNKSINVDVNNNTLNYPIKPIVTKKVSQKNIIYIVIDTWRFDCMTPEITPNIFAFSQKSTVFNNHMSGSNMTTGGIFSIFYGIPATYFYYFTSKELPPVMMSELQNKGYQFNVFSSSTLENPPFNRNVFAKTKNIPLLTEGNSPSERDSKINDLWISAIEKQDTKKPFFGFLFYDSAHGFDYPKNYKKPFNPDLDEVNYLDFDDDYNPKLLKNRYKNAISYVDSLIGKVIDQLEAKKILENTIIVITSDHGQEFNDSKKGYWQHGGNFSKYQIHVPMIIFDASKKPKVESELTLHYDISPTILKNYLGVTNNELEFSFGQNMFAKIKKRDYFVCGYNQKFSIIEPNKITSISPSGTLDVMDGKLNKLNEKEINYSLVSEGLQSLNRFYKKK